MARLRGNDTQVLSRLFTVASQCTLEKASLILCRAVHTFRGELGTALARIDVDANMERYGNWTFEVKEISVRTGTGASLQKQRKRPYILRCKALLPLASPRGFEPLLSA